MEYIMIFKKKNRKYTSIKQIRNSVEKINSKSCNLKTDASVNINVMVHIIG